MTVRARGNWYRDRGLALRMFLTIFLLGVVYLGFLAVLAYMGASTFFLVVVTGVFLGVQYFYSDRLVLRASGAHVVSEKEAPRLHGMIERLSTLADLPKPRIAVVESRVPNAFATGRSPDNAVVAVTTSLMEQLDEDELEAVLAHELTHVKSRDVMVLTIASFLSTVAFFVMRYLLFFGGGRRRDTNITLVWLASIAIWVLSFLLIRALSRYREYAADRGAAVITGHPGHLVSALTRISGEMDRVPQEDLRRAEGLNAFYVISALSGESILNLFSTHPPLEARISRLEELSRSMEGLP